MRPLTHDRRGDSAVSIYVSLVLSLLLATSDAHAGAAPPPADTPTVPVGEVAITASRSERSVLETPGNVTVIDREKIERSGARDVPELLRREAGLMVTNTTTNPEGYTVEARGFNDGGGDGSSLLVLVDGRRVNEPDSSITDWSWLRVGNVERIEVLRGPASALYGDNAVAGVVNVITRDTEGPLELTVRGWTGNDDTDGGSLFARGSVGPVSGSLYLDGVDTDGYRDSGNFEAHRYEAKLRGTVGEQIRLGLSAGYNSDERERPGALLESEIDTLSRRAAAPGTEGDEAKNRDHHVEGLIEWTPNENVRLQIVPSYRDRTRLGAITIPAGFLPRSQTVEDTELDSVGVTTQLEVDHHVGEMRNRLNLGVDILDENIDTEFVTTDLDNNVVTFRSRTDAFRHIYGGFFQSELNPTDRLLLSTGIRYDYGRLRGKDRLNRRTFSMKDTIWSPRGALTYRILDGFSAYVSYSQGFRFPNLNEAFGFFGFTPNLNPQKSRSYETGLKLRTERAAVNLALYRMDVDDQILFNHEAFTTHNIDRVRHRGFESSWDVQILEWLEFYGSYTHQDTKIRSDRITGLDGKRLPITPRHRGTAGLRAKLPFWFEFLWNSNFVGSRFLANDLTNDFERLHFFVTHDGVVAFRPEIREQIFVDLKLLVRNVFDREYSEFGGERTFSPGVIGFNPSPGRTFEVSLGVTLRR